MNRIDHTHHNHPATPAGRAMCRKSNTEAVTAWNAMLVAEGFRTDRSAKN